MAFLFFIIGLTVMLGLVLLNYKKSDENHRKNMQNGAVIAIGPEATILLFPLYLLAVLGKKMIKIFRTRHSQI